MDIAILRKSPQDRIRTVPLFGANTETADVIFCGKEEMRQVRELSAQLVTKGMSADDSYNVAFGRVALRGWSGLTDNGKDLPFTEENIDLLMLQSSEFRQAVLLAASSLRGGVGKNS